MCGASGGGRGGGSNSEDRGSWEQALCCKCTLLRHAPPSPAFPRLPPALSETQAHANIRHSPTTTALHRRAGQRTCVSEPSFLVMVTQSSTLSTTPAPAGSGDRQCSAGVTPAAIHGSHGRQSLLTGHTRCKTRRAGQRSSVGALTDHIQHVAGRGVLHSGNLGELRGRAGQASG